MLPQKKANLCVLMYLFQERTIVYQLPCSKTETYDFTRNPQLGPPGEKARCSFENTQLWRPAIFISSSL